MSGIEIIKTSDVSTVKIPKRSDLICVEKKDWLRLSKLINNLSVKTSSWENFFWFCLATFISLLITYFSVTSNKEIFLTSAIAFFVIAIIVFMVISSYKKKSKDDKKEILDEMLLMEQFEKDD